MSTLRIAGFAGLLVAAALVGGTVIGSVAATTLSARPSSAADAAPAASAAPVGERAAEYCAGFRRAFAAALGVDESALATAARTAAIATIDAAVADGSMRQVAADRLKAKIEAAAADGCALLAGRLGAIRGTGGGAGAVRPAAGALKDGVGAAAKALGMSPAELGARLRAGETLSDVAAAKGVAYEMVSAAVVASVKTDLDAAVAAGTLKQVRADRILARLERNLADGRIRNPRPDAPAASTPPATGS